MTDLMKRQLELEQEMIDDGVVRFLAQIRSAKVDAKRGSKRTNESQTAYGNIMIREAVQPFASEIVRYCGMVMDRPGLTPEGVRRLNEFDPVQAAFIASKTIIDSLSTPQRFVTLAGAIGQKLWDQEYMEALRNGEHANEKTGEAVKTKAWFDKLTADLKKAGTTDYTHMAKVYRNLGMKVDFKQNVQEDLKMKITVGKVLLDLFRLSTNLIEKRNVVKGKKTELRVFPTTEAEEVIQDVVSELADNCPDSGPLVVPPRPWTNPWDGGYHSEKMRERNPLIHSKSKLQYGLMDGYDYTALNALIACPWRINTDMLAVLTEEARNVNSGVLPSAEPLRPAGCPVALPGKDGQKVTKAARTSWWEKLSASLQKKYRKWKSDARIVYTKDKKRVSQRMQLGRIVKIASKYAEFDEIFFSWFLDYRGRKYAIGALSPQGTDFAKAVIEPAKAAPLGEHGLRWMQIHLTGVYGFDKEFIEDRVAWCHKHRQVIDSIAADPFGEFYGFWQGADKPFQFVAACKEYSNVMKQIDAGFPEEWVSSRMVVAQDGSCNGIQHFSAMLLDEVGGHAVNLSNKLTKPNDIYGDVAKVVIPLLEAEADPENLSKARLILRMTVNRKTTKRQTMIIPYGGTIMSCGEYSADWISDKYDSYSKAAAKGDAVAGRMKQLIELYGIQALGAYLGKIVWAALGKVVKGAVKAMTFIQQVSRAVVSGESSNTDGAPIWFKTAIGFPMVQDVKQMKELRVSTALCGQMNLKARIPLRAIDKAKMKTKIAPNFVHAQDSCHMSMTIMQALKKGVAFFACIHDSFGTLAGKSQELAAAIRESFVDLYENHNPLRSFWEHCKGMWEAYEKPRVKEFPTWESLQIHMGTLDLKVVLESPTFFL